MSTFYSRSPALYIRTPHAATHVQPHEENMDSFFYLELERALNEQSFGITRFQLARPTTSLEASAYVTLLEGNTVHISLSARGYQVCKVFLLPHGVTFLILELIGVDLISSRLSKTPATQRLSAQTEYSKASRIFCQH